MMLGISVTLVGLCRGDEWEWNLLRNGVSVTR